MKKISFFKKAVAFSLASTFFISNMPFNLVFANLQSNIRNLKIRSADEKNGYSINLEWENPEWSNSSDGGAINGADIHKPEGYKVFERNATNAGGTESMVQEQKGDSLTALKLANRTLVDGTIYEYKVTPYHNHNYASNTGTVSKPAPTDTATPQETALFMTDIKVEAFGSGNTLTVTFDNPKYGGKDIFTGYNIYYQKGGANVNSFNSVITVPIDNKDLIPSFDSVRKVNRLTYEITNNNIEQGNIYAVKVEPIINDKEIRDPSIQNPTITIEGNVQKRIGFNSKTFKEYRTNEANVAIPLYVLENGKQFLKLNWGDLSGVAPAGGIEYIGIYSGEEEGIISNLISTIYSQDAINVNSWRINKPTKKTYYQIKVKIRGLDTHLLSEIAAYDPNIVNITPNKPNIYPKLKIDGTKTSLDVYWDSFVRPAYNKQEENAADASGNILDKNIVYDVWITDSRKNLDTLGLPKVLSKVEASELTASNIPEAKNSVFNFVAEKYFTVDSNGAFLEKNIEENKTYYIRVVAIKPTSDGLGLAAQPSDSQIYIPARADISKPNSLSKPPLRIKKDEQGIDIIKQEEITIQWNRKWYEIYDEQTETWQSEAAIRNGQLVFGKEIKETDKIINFYDLSSVEDVKRAIKNAGYANADNLLVRQIDISQDNIKYELIVKPFDEVNTSGGYEAYIEKLLTTESEEWKEITPNFSLDKYAEYNITGLTENTRYAILLRPYRILTGGRKDAYPTYILATTFPKDTQVEVIPVTPSLYEVSKTDVSIEVAWKDEAKGISYELAVNEVIVDDPAKAKKLISSKDIKENGTHHTKDQENYIKYNIQNLFPDTGYYIWIRSIFDETDKKSEWSNPIYVRTEGIRKPSPPSGLGLASQKNLDAYNSSNNKDYKPSSSDYLIIEWLRDPQDLAEKATAPKTDNAEALLDPAIKNTYMVKFNKLLSNKEYYVRAKTKVYISKSNDGTIEKVYSYIVQISLKKDFKDFIEIEVPTITPKGEKVLTAESEWTNAFKFKTKKSDGSDGDYDGNVDNEVYPLPTEDFEVLYDGATQTLIYRFRSNKKDGNGNDDNLVDQRFITRLINDKVFNYKVDLTSHLGYSIKNRKVEIPYSILSAFAERKISFTVVANGTTFKFNPGFLNTSEANSLGKLGNDTTVYIDIAQNSISTPVIAYNQKYVSIPQELKISINKNGAKRYLSFLGSDMNVDIKLNDRTATLNNNVSIYKDTLATPNWQKMPSVYNAEKGTMALKTKDVGSYSVIATPVKSTDTTGNLTAVNSKILLTDLITNNLKAPISTVQFNNIVAGIANGKTEVSINKALSTKDYNSLKRSGMLVNGSVVGREAGINSLVKLYEMKTKASYKPTETIKTTPFSDIKFANKAYQLSFLKASELGFFGDSSLSRPKDTMTIEEVLYIVDIILEDSGY